MRITRKNPRYELPEAVIAVQECSPNLEPREEFDTPTFMLSQSIRMSESAYSASSSFGRR